MTKPIGTYKTYRGLAAYDKGGRTWPVTEEQAQAIEAEAGK